MMPLLRTTLFSSVLLLAPDLVVEQVNDEWRVDAVDRRCEARIAATLPAPHRESAVEVLVREAAHGTPTVRTRLLQLAAATPPRSPHSPPRIAHASDLLLPRFLASRDDSLHAQRK